MKYVRSRPWGTRGPWFDNRAGSRRRGHFHAKPADSGDDLVNDLLAATGFAWDRDLCDEDRETGLAPDSRREGAVPLAPAYHGHVDESGLRALERHTRTGDQPLAPDSVMQSAPEAKDSVLRRHDADLLPGRKSA